MRRSRARLPDDREGGLGLVEDVEAARAKAVIGEREEGLAEEEPCLGPVDAPHQT